MSGSTFTLSANDQTAAAFNAVSKRLENLNDKAGKVGKAMQTVGKVFGLAAGAAGVGMLAKAAFDASNAMNKMDASKIVAANQATDKAQKSLGNMAAIIGAKLAPFVEALANWFTKAMGDGKAFGDVVGKVFNGLVTVVGVFADAWRGIEVIWAGLKVVFQGFGLAVIFGLSQIGIAIVDLANLLPGVNLKYSETLQGMADAAGDSMESMKGDLTALLLKPLPSAGIKAFVAQTEAAANAHAKTVKFISKEEQKASEKAASDAAKLAAKQAEDLEKHTIDFRNSLTKQVDAIAERNMSAQQKLEEGVQLERDTLTTARANNLIDLETYEAQKLAVEQRYREQSDQLNQTSLQRTAAQNNAWITSIVKESKQGWAGRVSAAYTGLGQLSTLMQSDRKKEFELGKKAAIGQALIGTYLGVTEALKAPWFLAPFLAATALATGMMQVRSIRSQQFGGGGAANVGASAVQGVGQTGQPSAGGSGYADAPMLPQSSSSTAAQRNVVIQVASGNSMLDAWIRESLAPAMKEAAGDGVKFQAA